ncbi:unnamed protein product, partial [Phaeothamnion confervicola]
AAARERAGLEEARDSFAIDAEAFERRALQFQQQTEVWQRAETAARDAVAQSEADLRSIRCRATAAAESLAPLQAEADACQQATERARRTCAVAKEEAAEARRAAAAEAANANAAASAAREAVATHREELRAADAAVKERLRELSDASAALSTAEERLQRLRAAAAALEAETAAETARHETDMRSWQEAAAAYRRELAAADRTLRERAAEIERAEASAADAVAVAAVARET